MQLYEDKFIGRPLCNLQTSFIGLDSEELYSQNLKTQESDWYYRSNPITYHYNEFGHRSPSVDSIKDSNYILFAGCSFTEGVGLTLENTYPYLIAEQLGCSYYNIALGSTGIDALLHNVMMWLTTCSHKPAAIIIQWPDRSRFLSMPDFDTIVSNGAAWTKDQEALEFMALGEAIGFFRCRYVLADKMIRVLAEGLETKLINIRFFTKIKTDDIVFPNVDLARDLKHAGTNSHKLLSSEIVNLLR